MRNTTTNLTHCSKSHILYYSSNICILLLSGIRSITFSIYVELIFFAYIECVKRYLKYQLLRSKARPQKQSFSSLICLMKICVRTSLMEERGCVCEHVQMYVYSVSVCEFNFFGTHKHAYKNMLTNTPFHKIEFSYTNIHICRKEGKKKGVTK